MTPRQRKLVTWLKEWAPLVAVLWSVVVTVWVALGFGMVTPHKLFAELDRRLTRLEAKQDGLEAVQRFLCYLDQEKARLAGIRGCEDRTYNAVPGR